MRMLHALAKIMFRALSPRFYLLVGVVLFMAAYVPLTQDRFVLMYGGTKQIVTWQENPRFLWGVETVLVVAAAISFGAGIYCARQRQ